MRGLLRNIVICIVICVATSTTPYIVTPLDNDASTYQELVGTLHQSKDTWRFDIYMNMSIFYESVSYLKRGVEISSQKIKSIGSQAIYREINLQQLKLEKKLTDLQSIYNPGRRLKRDLLDKIGSVANVLFGIMDSNDADKIYSTLENLRTKDETIAMELERHRATINNVVTLYNETAKSIHQNFLTIGRQLNVTFNSIDETKRELLLTEIQLTMISQIHNLEVRINELIETAQAAYNGRISGQLFRSEHFTEAFARLHQAESKNIRLPFDLKNLHLQQLNAISKVSAKFFYNDNHRNSIKL